MQIKKALLLLTACEACFVDKEVQKQFDWNTNSALLGHLGAQIEQTPVTCPLKNREITWLYRSYFLKA